MASASHILFFSLSCRLLLLLLLFIQQTQSCPKNIHFNCLHNAYNNGSGETLLDFPFTNSDLPDCGRCVLMCDEDQNTRINCAGMEIPGAKYLRVLDINPSNHTIVAAYPDWKQVPDDQINDPNCLNSSLGFPTTNSVTFTLSGDFETLTRCPHMDGSPNSKHCDEYDVYGPYEHGNPPPPPPGACLNIQAPILSSEGNNFSIQYVLSDECNRCLASGGRCHNDDSYGEVHCDRPRARGHGIFVIIFSVFSGLTVSILVLVVYWLRRKSKGSSVLLSRNEFIRENKNFETVLANYAHLTPKRYTHSNIKKMTTSFKEKLGEGGFGGVYKGKLLDGRLVAVKLLKNSKGHGEGFINEVASIGRTNHINIVTLLGFCYEHNKRALVYEYMANGSLEKFMHGGANNGQSLPIETLFQIVLGIARGLEYLHRGCKTRILHFDIKPHNILLDEEFCPKISDFGLAKLTPQDKQSKVSMSGLRGTIGYIAPEVFCRTFGDVSHKSDVYSYGMMVLEVIGSRRRGNSQVENSSELYFPQYVYKHLEHGEEIEADITMDENEKQLKRKMTAVSLWCILPIPSTRPSMSTVLQMLEGSPDSIDIPPMPTCSSPPRIEWDPTTSSISTT